MAYRDMYHCYYDSPLGRLTMLSDGENLTGIYFPDHKVLFSDVESGTFSPEKPCFMKAKAWLSDFFSGRCPALDVPFIMKGTEFQKEVWEILLQIPYGKTMTYGEIAAIIAVRRGVERMSAQAVGTAVGRNPLSILVPCHRVVAANGRIGGYAGGVWRKEWLLDMERRK